MTWPAVSRSRQVRIAARRQHAAEEVALVVELGDLAGVDRDLLQHVEVRIEVLDAGSAMEVVDDRGEGHRERVDLDRLLDGGPVVIWRASGAAWPADRGADLERVELVADVLLDRRVRRAVVAGPLGIPGDVVVDGRAVGLDREVVILEA